jgi:hypothetical protein
MKDEGLVQSSEAKTAESVTPQKQKAKQSSGESKKDPK